MIRRFLKTFVGDTRGLAALEFALVFPVLGGLTLTGYGVWDAGVRHHNLQAALSVGASYYMNGGAVDATAETRSMDGWDRAPAGGTITATRVCSCGVTVVACNVVCAAAAPPSASVTLRGTGTTPGAVFSPTVTLERTLRVQ